MKTPLLTIENLHAGVEGKEILHGVELTIGSDETHVLMGPNGTGKSTLGCAITGSPAYTVTAGRILFGGEDITALDITARAKRGISYGFQQPPRFKGLRVWDLLSLASGNAQLTHAEGCQLLTQVGLCAADYIDREVDNSLSGGEVKRIEIATILARKSPLMIFDEPEAGIDLWSFAKLTETFRYIHEKRQATIIIISHQERIINLADEIVMIAGGEVVERGAKEEMFPKILENTQSGCAFVKGGAQA